MRSVYMVIPEPALAGRLVQELLDDGFAEQDMQLFGRQPNRLAEVPVSVTSLRSGSRGVWLRGLAGAGIAILGLIILSLAAGGAGMASLELLLIFALIGAAAGAGTVFSRRFPEDLRPLRGKLRPEDVVLRLEVPDERQGPLEEEIKARYPQVRVMGTAPGGSPPFPGQQI